MGGVVNATILSDGNEINPEYALVNIDIIKEVNKIPCASITVLDGDPAKQKYEISDTAFFEPGKEIEIKLRYEGEEDTTVFKGIVVRHSVKADKSGSFLSAELRDACVRLTNKRKNAVFIDQKDNEIISEIIKDGNLQVSTIHETKQMHKQMVQYYCTDWDFILSRADVTGLLVLPDDGSVSVTMPDLSGAPAHTFEYGIDEIYDFEMEADIHNQYKSVASTSWDVKEQKMLQPKEAKAFSLEQGNLDPAKLAETIGGDKCQLVSAVQEGDEEMQAWADAKMIKDRMSMLRGRIKVPGFAGIKPGDVMEVAGIGDRFNGKTLVTGIRHQFGEQGWQTDVQFGLKADWFSLNDNITDTPAAGLVPAVNGLQIGIVDPFEEDPDKQFRVKVKIPAIDETEGVVWARIASMDSGDNRGIFFIPEPGDEVVVGFFNDDPRQAVILGSLYSEKNAPPLPFEITEENKDKGIVTKGELRILFNDDEKSIEIGTPAGNIISMKDEEGIFLEDKNGNKLSLDDQGITIKSAKDIPMEGTNITIKGSKVDIN